MICTRMPKMKHLNNALKACYQTAEIDTSLGILNSINVKGNKLTFTIQDGPIKECGVNGIQVTDILEYCKELYKSLNKDFPCRENTLTITKIEEAIHWQEARTKDRESRNVEGFNKE